MRKGSITRKILEILAECAKEEFDLMCAILEAGYGASSGKIEYKLSQIKRQRTYSSGKTPPLQRYRLMISKLKRDGLIIKKDDRKGKFLSLTEKGLKKLAKLKKEQKNALPQLKYKKTPATNFTIIIFDIPEKERRKREWLRAVLKNLSFRLIQKSVWIGKVKIPSEFIKDLKDFDIINYVEIFEITKPGSLRTAL